MEKNKQIELAKEFATNTNSVDWGFSQIQLDKFVKKIEEEANKVQLNRFLLHLEPGVGRTLFSVKKNKADNILETEWVD